MGKRSVTEPPAARPHSGEGKRAASTGGGAEPGAESQESSTGSALAFAGPPHALRGEVPLANSSDVRLVVREVVAEISEPEPSLRVAQSKVIVVLKPGERRALPVQFDLGRDLAAGEYKGRVAAAGAEYPARFLVSESIHCELSPSELILQAHPGERIAGRKLTVRNLSNLKQRIAGLPDVLLYDQAELGPGGRLPPPALPSTGPVVPSANARSRPESNARASPEPLRLAVSSRAMELAPGDAALLELTFTVPEKISPGARYVGALHVLDSAVQVALYTHQAEGPR